MTIVPSASTPAADFSLMDGGPLRRLQATAGLDRGLSGCVRLGLAAGLLAWVPLLLLTALANLFASGPLLSFAHSLATHARLLVAIPLFFLAEALFDRRVRQVVRTLMRSRLVPATQRAAANAALGKALRLRDSTVLEVSLMAGPLCLILAGARAQLPPGISTWRFTPDGAPTAAGWWFVLFGLPMFQFLLLRWCVRLAIWAYLLRRLCRLDLRLVAIHPDQSGGLGGLGVAHLSLAPLNFGLSGIMAATFAEQILYAGADVQRVVLPLIVTVAGGTLVLIAPLLLFSPKLLDTRQRGLLSYGVLAASYTHAFDRKWLRPTTAPQEPLLGSADVQSLADLANAFDVVRHMRIVPIANIQILLLAVAAALPALPLVLFVVPLDELVIRGARTLLHV